MTNTSMVETLIDKATAVCGTQYAVAKRLNESQSNLSKMARGLREVSPRVAARLAAIVGQDPRDAACAALVDGEPDPEKRAELAALLQVRDWRKR